MTEAVDLIDLLVEGDCLKSRVAPSCSGFTRKIRELVSTTEGVKSLHLALKQLTQDVSPDEVRYHGALMVVISVCVAYRNLIMQIVTSGAIPLEDFESLIDPLWQLCVLKEIEKDHDVSMHAVFSATH